MGKNYRKEWETLVSMPIFKLKDFGFKIKELGGGMQTKSLRLKDKQGREWTLRTVEKDVEPNLPKWMHNTIAERTVQDMISAAHPYAPLTVPLLAKAMGIVVAEPTLYFVPADAGLEPYTNIFANTVCMLEEREPTPDGGDTKGTENMLEDLVEENDHVVMQQAVLKARLLDMLVGDWDRHADQWRWGYKDSADVKYYYAIPRDRDQAYFYSNGLLPQFARIVAMKHLISYEDDLSKLKNLNFKAWKFDGTFLNSLDRSQWESTIKQVQSGLTDEVISSAMKMLPPEIYPISGAGLEKKLRGRRDDLFDEGMKYYGFLTRQITINGTDDKEIFRITGDKEKLTLSAFAVKDGKQDRKLYERSFIPSETSYITLIGLGGDDQFIVEEGTENSIRLNIWGNKGADKYAIKGKVNNTIYDAVADGNQIEHTAASKIKEVSH